MLVSFWKDLLMLTGGGRGGPHFAYACLQRGEGGKNGKKHAYVICERSLMTVDVCESTTAHKYLAAA